MASFNGKHRDEGVRQHETSGWVVPPYQGLAAHDGLALHPDDRLEQQEQLAALHGVAEVLVQVEALRRRREHAGHEDLHSGPARGLRRVHGQLAVAQELSSTRVRLRRRGDTNAQADHQAATREFEGGSERLVKALRGLERVVGAADFLEEHGELVGTEPGDGVAGAERCRYPCRGRLKK